MASENETIADIVKRVLRDCNSYPLPTAAAEMLKLVREMDAAHQREVAELREDNARLRAALKPVLEVYISQDDNSVSVYDGRLDAAFALNAVREAKRIYNDGEERIASPSNCDRPECATSKAAQDVWRKEDWGKTAYHEWLLTSTKGVAK